MNANQFRNAILLLNCIDADEFAVLAPDPTRCRIWWEAFQKDPVKFYIHASAEHRAALWAIIEKRLTKGERK